MPASKSYNTNAAYWSVSRSASDSLSGITSTTLHVNLNGSISLLAQYGGVSLSANFSATSTMHATDRLTDGSIRDVTWTANASLSLSLSSSGDDSGSDSGSSHKEWLCIVSGANPRTTSSSSYTLTISPSCSTSIIDAFSAVGYI